MNKNSKKLLKLLLIIFVLFIGINVVGAESDCYEMEVITCGSGDNQIPVGIGVITRNIYNVVKLGIPILIIIFGIVDFARATIAGKEDDMNSSKGRFIRRIIAGFAVLLMFVIVQFVFNILVDASSGDDESLSKDSMQACISCFLFDEGDCNIEDYNHCPVSGDGAAGAGNTSKYCSDYEGSKCPSRDSYGNTCEKFTEHGQTKCTTKKSACYKCYLQSGSIKYEWHSTKGGACEDAPSFKTEETCLANNK